MYPVSNNNLSSSMGVNDNEKSKRSGVGKKLDKMDQKMKELIARVGKMDRVNKCLMGIGNKHVNALYPEMGSKELQSEQNKNPKRRAGQSLSEERQSPPIALRQDQQQPDEFGVIKKLHNKNNDLKVQNDELTKKNEALEKKLTTSEKTSKTLAEIIIKNQDVMNQIKANQDKSICRIF